MSILEEFGAHTGPGTVRLERYLPGPAERIWEYLTDGKKRGVWLAAGETEQRVGGMDAWRELARRLPNARFVELEESGHFTYLDEPEWFARVVIGFLN